MTAKCKLPLLLLAFISQCLFLFGQQAERYLEIRGHAELDMKPLGNATATLFDGSSRVSSVQTRSDGGFSFKLEANKLYTVEVSKDGMVAKKISFNTAIPDAESGIWVREFAIGLVVPCEGVDYSPLQKPVDIIKFNQKQRDFESDKKYMDGMMPLLEEIYVKSANCLSNKYDQLISQADKQFSQKKYEEARNTYQQASNIMSTETYPGKKIAEIDALLNQQKSKEDQYAQTIKEADALLAQEQYSGALSKYKAAAVLKPQETYSAGKINEIQSIMTKQQTEKQSAAATEAKYNDLIAKAGQAYAQKNYEMAKKYYQDALQINPAESAPRTKVKEIDALIEKQNQEQTQQKSVDDAYLAAIAEGDAMYKAKNFEAAKEAYAKAMTMKPSESYPRTRTQDIDKAIQQQVQDEKNAKVAELGRSLDSYLDEGDNQFKAKNYDAARVAYSNALKIKPDEVYAKQRINAIDKLLASDQAAKEKVLAEQAAREKAQAEQAAKEKALAEQAAKEKALAEQAAKEKALAEQAAREKTLAEQAEKAAREKALAEQAAKEKALAEQAAREKALAEQTAREKALAEQAAREKALAEQAAREKALAEQAAREKALAEQTAREKALAEQAAREKALAEQTAREKALAEQAAREKALADQAAREKALAEQLAREKALAEQAAREKALAEQEAREKALAEQAAREKALADRQAKELAEAKAKEDAYNNAVSSGNNAFGQKKYAEAKGFYGQALKVKPNDAYAKEQILLVDNILAEQEKQKLAEQATQKQYNDLIALADKAFDGNNYTVAKDNYQKALAVIPDSPYPKQKIARIDEIYKLLAQQKAQNTQQAAGKTPESHSLASAKPLNQLNFKNDAELDIYLNELKKRYPEGITLEVYKEKYRETRRYIVVRDNAASEYRDVLIKTYGGHEYSINGKTVTQMYFESQVKSRPGEYFNETVFE